MDINFNTNWNEKQKKALSILLNQKSIIKEIWYWWGAGGWKSYLGVFWIWVMCIKFSWIACFFGRKELKNLKRTTLSSYYKMLGDYKIPKKYHWVLNTQDSVIKFANWSVIYLLDLSNMPSDPLYLRFWSLELTIWFIDESNEISYSCIDILKTRVWRQKNKEYGIMPRILETFNPDKWHIYRRFYKPFKNNKLPNNRVFIPSLATDNKYLDDNYIESLKNADKITRERLLYWNFDYDDTPWRLFSDEDIQNLWSNFTNRENTKKYIIWDVAREWKDFATIWIWEWLELIDYKIIEKSKLNTYRDEIEKFREKYRVKKSNVAVDEDGVGGGVVDFGGYKWIVNNSRPIAEDVVDGKEIIPNYQNLKTQLTFLCSRAVREWKINLWVLEWKYQDMLSEELSNIIEIDIDKEWKKKIISKKDIKEKIWRSPDLADTLVYRFYFELNKKEIDIVIW